MLLVFQYRIEFVPMSNPPERKDVFQEHLRALIESHDFDYYMGALGGSVVTYGQIGRFDANATQNDRELLIDWLRQQPVKCIAMIGVLETNSENMKLMEPSSWFKTFCHVDAAVSSVWIATAGEMSAQQRETCYSACDQTESSPELGIIIDNLTDEDRLQADTYYTKIRAAIQRISKRKGGMSERTDPEA